MRVLLSDTWASGGASTFVSTLARGLASRGHAVDVVVGYRDSPAVEDYANLVRDVFRPPVDFNRLVMKGDYDIVHVTEDDLRPPFDYARRVRRLGLRTRVVVTSHQEHSLIPTGGADAVVYVSEASIRKAPGATRDAHVIPNGVDLATLTTQVEGDLLASGSAPAAVWVGRVEDPYKQKGFLGFTAAIGPLLDMGWRVLILDGSPVHDLYPVAEDLDRWFGRGAVGYANQVPRPFVLGALRRAGESGGALVSTSRYEAAPFIALEALAVGCPVVAPAISGYEALHESGYTSTYDDLEGLLRILGGNTFRSAPTGVPPGLSADDMLSRYVDLYASLAIPEVASGPRVRAVRTAVKVLGTPGAKKARQLLRR